MPPKFLPERDDRPSRYRLTPKLIAPLFSLFFLTACLPLPVVERLGIVIDPTRPPTSTVEPQPTLTVSSTQQRLATLEATPRTSSPADFNQRMAMLDEFQEDVELFPQATRYIIEVDVEFNTEEQAGTIDGIARILYTNSSSNPLHDLAVLLWPNDRQYAATMEVGSAMINGQLVEPEEELGGLAARYLLPEPVSTGGQIDASIPFFVEASGPIGGAQPRRFGISQGVLFTPTFYPLVPRRLAGEWELEPAPPGGDTTSSEVAFYDVTLTHDPTYELVASGSEIDRTSSPASSQVRYSSGPMRDFAFALGTFLSDSRIVDDVVVNVWVIEEHEQDIPTVLNSAVAQLKLFNDLVGPYPYKELDLIDLPGAFGGIEYPGLVTVGTLGTSNVIDPTVHEVAHQWFYGLIGNDQVEEPWLDEAIATFSQVLYYEDQGMSGRASGMLSYFRSVLGEHPNPETAIGDEIREYRSPGDYGLFVYFKGALFMERLRSRMGEDLFREFLRNYFEEYRYGFATSADFQSTAEATCDCDLGDLFDLWVFEGGDPQLP